MGCCGGGSCGIRRALMPAIVPHLISKKKTDVPSQGSGDQGLDTERRKAEALRREAIKKALRGQGR